MSQAVEPIVLPPIEAFLIRPQFTVNDLWAWPLFLFFAFVWIRSLHRAAGLMGRDVDVLISLKALNGLFLWGTIIGLSRAVHRVTDDVIVSGVWIGVTLALWTGIYRAIIRFTPLASVDKRARAAVDHYRAEIKAKEKGRKAAKARGEVFKEEGTSIAKINLSRVAAAEARGHTAVFLRKDLFAIPETGSPTPAEPAPEGGNSPAPK